MPVNRITYYDFVGVLGPGALLITGLLLLVGELEVAALVEDISIGGFGLSLVVGYVAGQIVQAVGLVIQALYWRAWGGLPTDWVRSRGHRLLSPEQVRSMELRLPILLHLPQSRPISGFERWEWGAITRQIAAAVRSAGQGGRVDVFNANYGLARGVAVVLISLAGITAAASEAHWMPIVLGVLAVLMVVRMHAFGVNYARELYAQFLQMPVPDLPTTREEPGT